MKFSPIVNVGNSKPSSISFNLSAHCCAVNGGSHSPPIPASLSSGISSGFPVNAPSPHLSGSMFGSQAESSVHEISFTPLESKHFSPSSPDTFSPLALSSFSKSSHATSLLFPSKHVVRSSSTQVFAIIIPAQFSGSLQLAGGLEDEHSSPPVSFGGM